MRVLKINTTIEASTDLKKWTDCKNNEGTKKKRITLMETRKEILKVSVKDFIVKSNKE